MVKCFKVYEYCILEFCFLDFLKFNKFLLLYICFYKFILGVFFSWWLKDIIFWVGIDISIFKVYLVRGVFVLVVYERGVFL